MYTKLYRSNLKLSPSHDINVQCYIVCFAPLQQGTIWSSHHCKTFMFKAQHCLLCPTPALQWCQPVPDTGWPFHPTLALQWCRPVRDTGWPFHPTPALQWCRPLPNMGWPFHPTTSKQMGLRYKLHLPFCCWRQRQCCREPCIYRTAAVPAADITIRAWC